MGFIPLEDALVQAPTTEFEKVSPATIDSGFSAFDVADLASEKTMTGMKEEVILLSWLMVLLRSREDSQISYDWSYTGAQITGPETVNTLSMNEVMKGLESNVAEVATAISQKIPAGVSSSASMIVSTSSLLRDSETIKDEVSPLILWTNLIHC